MLFIYWYIANECFYPCRCRTSKIFQKCSTTLKFLNQNFRLILLPRRWWLNSDWLIHLWNLGHELSMIYDSFLETPRTKTPRIGSSRSDSVCQNSVITRWGWRRVFPSSVGDDWILTSPAEDGEGLLWNIWFKSMGVVDNFKDTFDISIVLYNKCCL